MRRRAAGFPGDPAKPPRSPCGSDTLDISSSSGNGVNVDGKVNLIGGAGQDQFHTGAGNQYLGTKKEDFELGDSL
ncbi:MAG TPA: hypothetical protein VHR66_15065 [Gemmataceae bacterium]|nr:hypothetical protein [Gemmataceae bacterium]